MQAPCWVQAPRKASALHQARTLFCLTRLCYVQVLTLLGSWLGKGAGQ